MVTELQIDKEKTCEMLTVRINGDLNVKTSPYLEEELTKSLVDVKELILDFAAVEYISSAGLRVLLAMEKTMRRQRNHQTGRLSSSHAH